MFLEYIKNWIYEKELKKTGSGTTTNGGQIGIIMDYTKNNNVSEDIIRLLNQNGVQKEKIVFITYHNVKEKLPQDLPVFTKDQLHWSGYPKSVEVEKFITYNFNAVYYLASNFDKHFLFILSKIRSNFMAGVYHKGIEQYLDLTIDTIKTDPVEILKELLQMITKLKEKK